MLRNVGAQGPSAFRRMKNVDGYFFPDHFFLNHHFYFPAQLVGGFTLSDLLDKPWSRVLSLFPPGTAFILYRA